MTVNGTHPGVTAMNRLSQAEKQFLHTKLVRFLDGTDTSAMTIVEIAEAVGISTESVRKELRARNGGQPLTPGRKSARRRKTTSRRRTHSADVLQAWLEDNPGMHTMLEMQEGTGLTKSTVRNAVLTLGVAPMPARRGRMPFAVAPPLDDPVAFASADEEAKADLARDVAYVSTLQDGTLVGQDKVSGLLWTLVPGQLL